MELRRANQDTGERETCDWCGEKLQAVQPLCSCCIDDTNDFHGQDLDESHWSRSPNIH